MKIKLLLMLSFLLLCSQVYAAEPIVEVPALPTGAALEIYEDSEELFALKTLEYYKIAVALESQLLLMGISPDKAINQPTLEELQDMDTKTLKKFYNQAVTVSNSVKESPDGLYHKKIEDLRAKVTKMQNDNFILKEQLFAQSLELHSSEYYRLKYREIIKQTDSLRLYIDSTYYNYQKQLWHQADNMRRIYENSANAVPILSLSAGGSFWNIGDERISSDISPSVSLVFNPSPIFGIGRIVDIWADYQYPSITSGGDEVLTIFPEKSNQYKTDFFSTGLNLNIPISEAMKIENFYLGFKVGYGFFWGQTEMPNTNLGASDWQGQVVHLELNASNYNRLFFPIGVFVSFNFYKFSNEFEFPAPEERLRLGKPWINNFQLGLRFPLWISTSAMEN